MIHLLVYNGLDGRIILKAFKQEEDAWAHVDCVLKSKRHSEIHSYEVIEVELSE